MRRQTGVLRWILLLLALAVPASAQVEQATDSKANLADVRAMRSKAESDPGLEDAIRAQALELYDAAITALESELDAERRGARHDRERTDIDRQVAALRKELERTEELPRLGLPDDAGVQRAERELARERSGLAAHRSALEDAEQAAEARDRSRNEAARRLGTLDQQVEKLSDELRSSAQLDVHAAVRDARRQSLLARRQAAEADIGAIRTRLDLLDERAALIPWQIDLAQRRVAFSEARVEMLERAARELRRTEARAQLRGTHEACELAAAGSPLLVDLASETATLAEKLWGADGVEVRLEQSVRTIGRTRRHIADLSRIAQLTRRQFEAFGRNASVNSWWPDVPEDFPDPGDVAKVLRNIERQIPEVQHDLILFEQARAESREVGLAILDRLAEEENASPELVALGRDLLGRRQDLLEELIQNYAKYSSQLGELQRVSRRLFDESESIQAFLYERLLWVRSVPRPIVRPVPEFTAAAAWLFSAESWGAALVAVYQSISELPGKGLGLIAIFVLLILLRRGSRRRQLALSEQVRNPETDSFRATLEALLHSAVLAAPLPLALYFLGEALLRPDAPTFLFAASKALYYLASIAGLLTVTRELFSRGGLAEVHFDWSEETSRPIRRSLHWPMLVFLPLIYIALHLSWAGMRLDSPAALQAANNSLGRAAFVVGLLVLGIALLNAWRPSREDLFSPIGRGQSLKRRLYLITYPFIALATIVPAILATAGYYITGYLLAYQMLRTLWVLVIVLVLGGLLFRWHRTASRAVEEVAGATGEARSGDAQVRTLFRFGIVLFVAFSIASIWSEALPALQLLKRVQLLPRVELLDAPDEPVAGAPAPAAPAEVTEASAADKPAIPGLPVSSSTATPAAQSEETPLTLWQLIEAILALSITMILVRNVPGLIELTLRRRTTLEAGTRVAVSTLTRYSILIFGVSIAFSLLGISWSKIQWLAAALTFGLGFGLQEIVANFVSGLILLLERPVRVGDAVTIGNLQGRVTEIRIRATTITLWDRSEMIVPNKEFITTKLINWTLSDSRRRIDIPLRVAYHSDVQLVKQTLLEVARNHPVVLDDPPPSALLLEFGNEALCFELRYFVDFGMGLQTRDEVSTAIEAVFEERGIEFALPQLSIRVPGGVPRAPE